MDFGCVTPLYIYRLWGGQVPLSEIEKALKIQHPIPKGIWHTLESLESGSCIFECKEGLFVPHKVDGLLEVNTNRVD